MAGTHQITSSLFVQSGSTAQFKSGISSSKITSKDAIFAREFQNFNFGSSDGSSQLSVGMSSGDGNLIEGTVGTNNSFRLSASGDFNHFTFIEKRPDGWFQISTGSQNGTEKKSFVDIEGKPTSGIYEYLVLAMSTSSLKTVTKGTTVTIVD